MSMGKGVTRLGVVRCEEKTSANYRASRICRARSALVQRSCEWCVTWVADVAVVDVVTILSRCFRGVQHRIVARVQLRQPSGVCGDVPCCASSGGTAEPAAHTRVCRCARSAASTARSDVSCCASSGGTVAPAAHTQVSSCTRSAASTARSYVLCCASSGGLAAPAAYPHVSSCARPAVSAARSDVS